MKKHLLCLITAGSLALTFQSAAGTAHAKQTPEPIPVPSEINVPDGHVEYARTHATGTQNYTCVPTPDGYKWKGAPQATLFVNHKWMNRNIPQQIATHYLSPNPDEGGTPRPTWQSSIDTSAVWGNPDKVSSDPAYVEAGAIPWLRLQVVGARSGPAGGDILSNTTWIQRVNTSGGVAPALPCSESENAGVTKFVPYETDYVFFREDSKK